MSICTAMECDGCGALKKISGQLPEDDELEDGWTFDDATHESLCPECVAVNSQMKRLEEP